jgi:hypothetical protein
MQQDTTSSPNSINTLLCEVPLRSRVFWFGMTDMKSSIKGDVYKDVISEKLYLDMFTKEGKQICFNKEIDTEENCYENFHIVIDDLANCPEEYE